MHEVPKGKKAQSPPAGKVLFYIIFAIVLPIVFLIFILSINSSAKAEAKIPESLEATTLKASYFFDKDCFAYDWHGVSRGYVIDLSKFSMERLNICVKDTAIRLTLKSRGEIKILKTQQWVDGKPIRQKSTEKIYVSKDNEIIPSDLIMELQ